MNIHYPKHACLVHNIQLTMMMEETLRLQCGILFFFPLQLTGMTAVGVGTWQLTDENKVISDAVNFILDPFVVLCIIGAITFTVAFLGCVGAAREHAFMIKMVCLNVHLRPFVKTVLFSTSCLQALSLKETCSWLLCPFLI